MNFLNQPVPHIIFTSTLQYAFTVTGAGLMFSLAFWSFCLIVRNAIDFPRTIRKAVARRHGRIFADILLGKWTPVPERIVLKAKRKTVEWIAM